MESTKDINIDEETISKIGLQPSDKAINAQISSEARVFAYPHLENVFIMESDLYGNKVPKGSCFLAFTAPHGVIGIHLKVEALKNATPEDIKNMVESHQEG